MKIKFNSEILFKAGILFIAIFIVMSILQYIELSKYPNYMISNIKELFISLAITYSLIVVPISLIIKESDSWKINPFHESK